MQYYCHTLEVASAGGCGCLRAAVSAFGARVRLPPAHDKGGCNGECEGIITGIYSGLNNLAFSKRVFCVVRQLSQTTLSPLKILIVLTAANDSTLLHRSHILSLVRRFLDLCSFTETRWEIFCFSAHLLHLGMPLKQHSPPIYNDCSGANHMPHPLARQSTDNEVLVLVDKADVICNCTTGCSTRWRPAYPSTALVIYI